MGRVARGGCKAEDPAARFFRLVSRALVWGESVDHRSLFLLIKKALRLLTIPTTPQQHMKYKKE
ncbi:hypothetical protein [Laceyella putida]|uniref:Uncharacterized protein n=1 Tax=Laceyella putida TaxID=110101 RepID=A0ABW2RKW1_9BACL